MTSIELSKLRSDLKLPDSWHDQDVELFAHLPYYMWKNYKHKIEANGKPFKDFLNWLDKVMQA